MTPRLLVDDFEKPNGLAFSPDERTLYVCDTGRYHVRAFEVETTGPSEPAPAASSLVSTRVSPAARTG